MLVFTLHQPDVGSLNMLHCGRVNMPNPLKHGSILKAVADTRGSSLFDGGATHIVHEDDKGAIPGSWQPDVAGLICEATMMRWIFGLKTHTENDVEGCINLFLASMRLLRPDLSIDIIRSDGAPENRSHR